MRQLTCIVETTNTQDSPGDQRFRQIGVEFRWVVGRTGLQVRIARHELFGFPSSGFDGHARNLGLRGSLHN